MSVKIRALLLVTEERPGLPQDRWGDWSAFWGAANELHLIFMKLHGKLLICARNESVERESLINIHRGLRRAEVDEWLEQPARLMTQIWVTYPEGGSWKPVTPLPQFLSLEMGLITHKSLAQLQVDQGRAWLERGVLTPPSFTTDHCHCGITDDGHGCTEGTGSHHFPASVSLLKSLGAQCWGPP